MSGQDTLSESFKVAPQGNTGSGNPEPTIPLVRPVLGGEERAAVDRVLSSGMLAQGPETAAFEDDFSHWVSGRTCVAVNSGTMALHLGLVAAGIGPGDEVILPSFTFAATANAVRLAGATPVFADIEGETFCLDPAAVEAAITSRTAAVIAVHLYGHPADVDALVETTRRHQLLLVEDAAQAHGATSAGRPVGSFGAVAAFSFYPTKNMTTGEGGMVVAEDAAVARTVRLLRNQGMDQRYYNELIGVNGRMTDIAAAIGRVQLRKLGDWNNRRRANARNLDLILEGVVTPTVRAGARHVFNQYTVRTKHRDGLRESLAQRGIGSGIYYPVPVHRLPPYAQRAELPQTELAAREVLSLPVRPDLEMQELRAVANAVTAWATEK